MLGKRKRGAIAPPPKKRKNTSTIEEITFDFGAREDYLSGFHKRKLQRIKHAKEEAAKKEREDKIIARKQLREERKADLERHVQAVNSLLEEVELPHDDLSNDEEDVDWAGIKEPPTVIDHEAEYEDEDRHTTVTIEAVDVTRDGLQKSTEVDASDEEEESAGEKETAVNNATGEGPTQRVKRIWTKEKPQGPKKKKKKFRYESKVERKATRFKERSANKAKAKARRE